MEHCHIKKCQWIPLSLVNPRNMAIWKLLIIIFIPHKLYDLLTSQNISTLPNQVMLLVFCHKIKRLAIASPITWRWWWTQNTEIPVVHRENIVVKSKFGNHQVWPLVLSQLDIIEVSFFCPLFVVVSLYYLDDPGRKVNYSRAETVHSGFVVRSNSCSIISGFKFLFVYSAVQWLVGIQKRDCSRCIDSGSLVALQSSLAWAMVIDGGVCVTAVKQGLNVLETRCRWWYY